VTHDERTAALVRRVVSNPNDEAGWLAYAADLADNGDDALALVVRTYWPAMRDTLEVGRPFPMVMRDVRKNLTTLHRAAARIAEAECDRPRE
jgi:hypothetical protein